MTDKHKITNLELLLKDEDNIEFIASLIASDFAISKDNNKLVKCDGIIVKCNNCKLCAEGLCASVSEIMKWFREEVKENDR